MDYYRNEYEKKCAIAASFERMKRMFEFNTQERAWLDRQLNKLYEDIEIIQKRMGNEKCNESSVLSGPES